MQTRPFPVSRAPSRAAASATRELLRSFRRQRPIRGGSLIITIFGDCIAPRGGTVTLGSLIDLTQPFGLTERLVRTSVARLAQDDWLVARRDGRRSEYCLSPPGQKRFAEATQRIYGQAPASWDGEWTMLLLPPGAPKDRKRLPDELRWLGFGEVSARVFAHPGGELSRSREWLLNLGVEENALLLRSQSADRRVDRKLVEAGWNLAELTSRYTRFVETFTPVREALRSALSLDGEAAFVIRTLLIHEYRKIHLQDPLLPPALLPAEWVGGRAYDLCGTLYGAVFAAAESFLSANASTLENPLPPAQRAAYERFGGIR